MLNPPNKLLNKKTGAMTGFAISSAESGGDVKTHTLSDQGINSVSTLSTRGGEFQKDYIGYP